LSENLCANCIHRDVCPIAVLGKAWNLKVSACNQHRLSFSKADLKAAEEEQRRIE